MRLTEDEFWRLTLLDLDVLYRRHVQARDHLEMVAGIIASAIANFGFRASKKWAEPSDFGLDAGKRRSASKPGLQSIEDIRFRWASAAAIRISAKKEEVEDANEAGGGGDHADAGKVEPTAAGGAG